MIHLVLNHQTYYIIYNVIYFYRTKKSAGKLNWRNLHSNWLGVYMLDTIFDTIYLIQYIWYNLYLYIRDKCVYKRTTI